MTYSVKDENDLIAPDASDLTLAQARVLSGQLIDAKRKIVGHKPTKTEETLDDNDSILTETYLFDYEDVDNCIKVATIIHNSVEA